MHLCISYGPKWVHSALFWARSVLPTHLSANLVSPARPTSSGVAKLLASVEHGCPRVCMHRWAVSPALRWRSSEREKKLSNGPAASSFFDSFRPFCRSISNLQLICPIYRLIWLIFGQIFDRWLRTPCPACPVQCNINTKNYWK